MLISSSDSVLGHSVVPSRKSILLSSLVGNTGCSARNAEESSLISRRGGCLMGFLELRQEPGVYFRVIAEMAIRNSTLFREGRTPS